jgi:hypothetical protein
MLVSYGRCTPNDWKQGSEANLANQFLLLRIFTSGVEISGEVKLGVVELSQI